MRLCSLSFRYAKNSAGAEGNIGAEAEGGVGSRHYDPRLHPAVGAAHPGWLPCSAWLFLARLLQSPPHGDHGSAAFTPDPGSPGTAPNPFPPSLLQEGDGLCLTPQPHSPAALPNRSLVAAGYTPRAVRNKWRKKKVWTSPTGHLPSCFYQYQQHRPSLEVGRSPATGPSRVQKVPGPATVLIPSPSAATRMEGASPDLAPLRPVAPDQCQLRKEVLKSMMGKSEKIALPHGQLVHGIHLYEQPKINRKANIICH
ncbi:Proline-rich nuclear receptor coactivator 1 [Saguinus oedipus]|uniref:Proline-rich nuclear receptor coactivator 1 n=1 Tax=Saguinus oedipus TaxID=9490 RepID=A0ABQ9UGC3_SAGOE|nr:Proline-rich nuclear receptor coactivator 1 [Saguinus oedipus]